MLQRWYYTPEECTPKLVSPMTNNAQDVRSQGRHHNQKVAVWDICVDTSLLIVTVVDLYVLVEGCLWCWQAGLLCRSGPEPKVKTRARPNKDVNTQHFRRTRDWLPSGV